MLADGFSTAKSRPLSASKTDICTGERDQRCQVMAEHTSWMLCARRLQTDVPLAFPILVRVTQETGAAYYLAWTTMEDGVESRSVIWSRQRKPPSRVLGGLLVGHWRR